MKTTNQNTVEKLNKLLADYQIYYQNLRGLHWNIKGLDISEMLVLRHFW
ncbi:MAG: hypothetical protein AAGU19_21915 [Prolixibacteraceae bacterium]